jgi:hypothetical protein
MTVVERKIDAINDQRLALNLEKEQDRTPFQVGGCLLLGNSGWWQHCSPLPGTEQGCPPPLVASSRILVSERLQDRSSCMQCMMVDLAWGVSGGDAEAITDRLRSNKLIMATVLGGACGKVEGG